MEPKREISKVPPTCLSTLGFGRVENTLLLYETPSAPEEKKGNHHPESEWREWLEFATEAVSGSNPATGMVVMSDGRSPTIPQIRTAKERMPDGFKSATMTSSLMARGATTAFSWVNPNIKAFGPQDLEKAMDHAGVEQHAGVRAAIRSALTALRFGCTHTRMGAKQG